MATTTLLVFSVPLVAGDSGRAFTALLGALVLSELLELPDVELEAAKAVWHIMVHIATLKASAKIFFFTLITSLSKLANSDLLKQGPKPLSQPWQSLYSFSAYLFYAGAYCLYRYRAV
jgi:hypothetical protein